jgi:two-component system chemotaxis response regulator CheB
VVGKQIRILVVDDSVVMREVLRTAIQDASDMIVVGTAGDGRQALAQAKTLRPDVVTLDVQMPNMDGLATVEAPRSVSDHHLWATFSPVFPLCS